MDDTEKDILRNRKPIFSIDSILSQKMTSTKDVKSDVKWKTDVVRHEERAFSRIHKLASEDMECLSRCSCEKCQRRDDYSMTMPNPFDDDLENRCYSLPSYYQEEKSSEDLLNLKFSRYFKSTADNSSRFNKRRRTIFTSSQLERLECEFQQQQYIVGQERRYLARQLGLNEIQVKVWFQNRRIKWRKFTHGTPPDLSL